MPANFPEIWLNRVIHNLDNTDVATFLNGISELGVDVSQINEGTISEQNKIYLPVTDFEVDVLINNTTYPIDVQAYDDDTLEVSLDKYQTKVTTLSDDAIMGASYPKIDEVTKSHVHAIASNKFKKAIHAIAPASATAKMPVFTKAGEHLTYEDLVNFKQACDDAGFGDDPIRLVLTPTHWNDLLRDRENFGDQLVNYVKGKPNPEILGFELHKYSGMPYYDAAGAKKAFGAEVADTDVQASVAFIVDNIAKKTGITKQYFAPAKGDPENQTNRLNYRHYFIVTPKQAMKVAAIL